MNRHAILGTEHSIVLIRQFSPKWVRSSMQSLTKIPLLSLFSSKRNGQIDSKICIKKARDPQ